jgi:uncharacterized coiled-coil protein SlyX
MSQTETLLLVVLGFALATLLALFVGRFAWGLALRIGARRMQKHVPSTVKDLQTERDRLRADYALLSQKLGSHLESVKARMAEQMAEVARSRNRLQALSEDMIAREAAIAERDSEIRRLKERVTNLELGLAEAATAAEGLAVEIAAREARIAKLEGEVLNAAVAPAAPVPIAAAAIEPPVTDALQKRIRKLTGLSDEIAGSRQPDPAAQGVATPELPADLGEKLAEAERETEKLQAELARLDAAWAGKLQDLEQAAEPAASPRPAGPAAAAPDAGTSPAVANVISLAHRIRSLQKDIAG